MPETEHKHPEMVFYDGFMTFAHHPRIKKVRKPPFFLHKFYIMNKIFQFIWKMFQKSCQKIDSHCAQWYTDINISYANRIYPRIYGV